MFRVIALTIATSLASAPTSKAPTHGKAAAGQTARKAEAPAAGEIKKITARELKLLKTLDATYQAKNAEMKVTKITKIPLLDQERKTSGTAWISSGRLRMELDGSEKSLLVVNKHNLWAVTYPPAEFKDAALQVIKANTSTKKGRSQSAISLLSMGGLTKFFDATAAQTEANGDVLFFLSPKQEQTDLRRAQALVSADGKKLLALNYWDDRDNETRMVFTDVKFVKKADDKLFDYTPPANADVMNL